MTASGTYVDGTPFSVSGAMNGNNDSHGTHVGGTLGASRDGVGMHGVAYAAQVYVANTNQNDSFLFGPTPDPNYFKAAYQALADAGVRAINNSWGSQPRTSATRPSTACTPPMPSTTGAPPGWTPPPASPARA